MNKKIIYTMLVLIIIASAILIPTIGFKLGTDYSENTKIYVYIGKKFNNNDLKQIILEVFKTENIKIQKVEVYEDMACITIPKQENITDKEEELKTKINEKFELKLDNEDIEILNQSKVDMNSIIKPYIWQVTISSIIILIYAAIMYKKLGIAKTVLTYILAILAPEAAYIVALILAKLPVNTITIPVALTIYMISILVITIIKQKQLEIYKLNEK